MTPKERVKNAGIIIQIIDAWEKEIPLNDIVNEFIKYFNPSPSDNTQIRDGWVRMEDMEKEYKRGFDDGVKYRDGQHKAYFTIES